MPTFGVSTEVDHTSRTEYWVQMLMKAEIEKAKKKGGARSKEGQGQWLNSENSTRRYRRIRTEAWIREAQELMMPSIREARRMESEARSHEKVLHWFTSALMNVTLLVMVTFYTMKPTP